MTPAHATLAQALEPDAVSIDVLRRRHGAILKVIVALLGFEPNDARFLEIWPVGLRTCNLLVPSFLNMPALVLSSGDRKKRVGLVMYAASRAAQCAYCSAHSCSFALRRGASASAVAHALACATDSEFNAEERAALEVATAMGQLPDSVTDAKRDALSQLCSGAEIEQLVLTIALMGFLNKFNDAVGVPLEPRPFNDASRILATSGWSAGKHQTPGTVEPTQEQRSTRDSLGVKLRLFPLMPSLIASEWSWTMAVPGRWPQVGEYLRERTGYDYPVLSRLHRGRAIRALATALRDNTDPSVSALGLRTKSLAGIVYATIAEDARLLRAAELLAERAGVTTGQRAGAVDGLDAVTVIAKELALAASSSPSQITPEIISRSTHELTPPAIVELIVWIALLQTVHRLHAFYP